MIPKHVSYKEASDGRLTEEVRSAHDLLLQLLHLTYDVAVFAKYAESAPEVCLTLPRDLYDRLEEQAKHSVFKATNWGVHPISGLPWFEYNKLEELGTPVRLIVQQGVESGALEVKN